MTIRRLPLSILVIGLALALLAPVRAAREQRPVRAAREQKPVRTARDQKEQSERFWAQWRGPYATGVSRTAHPPLEWSETKNVKWKIEIPGRGAGTPVVWGDRVYVLTAVPVGLPATDAHIARGGVEPRHVYRFVVLAVDRRDGRIVWERVAHEERPHESTHPLNGTWASSSAITDGEHVIAYFESNGLYVYDVKGTLIWQKALGHKNVLSETGEGTTPALYGDYLVVVWDHQGESGSFIVAFDKRTGREIWKADRDELDTWATPLIVEHDGHPQVITSGWGSIRSYDLETGKVLWHTGGLTPLPIPSPVTEDGMVFATSGFNGNSLKAIRLANAGGDITGTGAIAWSLDRDTPYVPSPLLYDSVLYLLKSNSGILSVFDAKTGTPHYRLQRLQAVPNVYASPVGADGRVYIAGREGATLVIRHGPKFEVLATNSLDDEFMASLALVGNEVYLRGDKHLYCIAETAAKSPAH